MSPRGSGARCCPGSRRASSARRRPREGQLGNRRGPWRPSTRRPPRARRPRRTPWSGPGTPRRRRCCAGASSRIGRRRAPRTMTSRHGGADRKRQAGAAGGLEFGQAVLQAGAIMSNKMWGGRFASGPDASCRRSTSPSTSTSALAPGHRRLARARRDAGEPGHHYERGRRRAIADGLDHGRSRDRGRDLPVLARARGHPHERGERGWPS